MSDSFVEKQYVRAGIFFGDAVYHLYAGKSDNFTNLLDAWGEWEREYSARGYRTRTLDEFIAHGAFAEQFENKMVKREEGEESVLHSNIFREHCLSCRKLSVECGRENVCCPVLNPRRWMRSLA